MLYRFSKKRRKNTDTFKLLLIDIKLIQAVTKTGNNRWQPITTHLFTLVQVWITKLPIKDQSHLVAPDTLAFLATNYHTTYAPHSSSKIRLLWQTSSVDYIYPNIPCIIKFQLMVPSHFPYKHKYMLLIIDAHFQPVHVMHDGPVTVPLHLHEAVCRLHFHFAKGKAIFVTSSNFCYNHTIDCNRNYTVLLTPHSLICNCLLLKDISFNTFLLVWCD